MKYFFLLFFLGIFANQSCTNHSNTIEQITPTYLVTSEKQLNENTYANEIEKFYENGLTGYFNGKSNINIYYKCFIQTTPNHNAIMIASGRGEPALKYKELIYDLFNNGYSVYIHDHRGQGLSQRMLPNPLMGHIDSFQHYIDDMKYFYEHVITTSNPQNIFLLAHSMGGAIGISYLEQYPNDFNAVALTSPMFGFKAPTCFAIKLLISDSLKYAPGQGNSTQISCSFEENVQTNSKIRYNRMVNAFTQNPKSMLGGPTINWVHSCCQQFDYIFDNINNIKTPIVMFMAGNEAIVSAKACISFEKEMNKLGKICPTFLINNAQHELLMDSDTVRNNVINKMLFFFQSHVD